MTELTATPPVSTSPVRFVVGYLAILATLPYLVLKLAWLSGSTVGFNDPALVHDSGLYSLNAVTAGLDAVAVLLALTFTHRWGLHAPAWLITLPIWVGTGLLAPIAVAGPVAGLVAVGGNVAMAAGRSPVQPWVFGMVYTGFVCQGLALVVAFLLYARVRWPELFRSRVADRPAGATRGIQALIGTGAAVAALLAAGLHLAWSAGATVGFSARELAGRTALDAVVEGTFGVFTVAAAIGVLMMVGRFGGRVRFWVPLVLTWAGSGSMFAWGVWSMVNVLGQTVLTGGSSPLPDLHQFGKVVIGLLIAVVGAFALADRPGAVPAAASPERAGARPVPAESATIV